MEMNVMGLRLKIIFFFQAPPPFEFGAEIIQIISFYWTLNAFVLPFFYWHRKFETNFIEIRRKDFPCERKLLRYMENGI